MTGTSEETGIVDVTIRNAELTDQSELISQLMQRIADMQEELQQTKDLAKLAIASNEPPLETRRPPPPFPSLSSPLPNYFPTHSTGPITSTPNPHTIDLTISNAPYANTSYQTPPPLPNQNQAPNTNLSQIFIPNPQIPPPVPNNPQTRNECYEGCHLRGIIEEFSQGTDFHMVEIMNAAFEDTALQVPMPQVYKMLATTMLRSGFEPGRGLGKNLDGISEPLPIPLQNFHFGVGYTPTEEELFEAETRKKHDFDIPKPNPVLYQSFVAKASEPEIDSLLEGMGRLFDEEDCAVISAECTTTPTIRDAEPGEMLQNWIATPLMIHRMAW
uniref:Gag/pol polyprotein n=1 Tax=Solanum tuberosum TaxID=4113 RepID=M1DL98_SOLTU